ncbi:MAG: hypothetical protein WCQ99_08620 [Pseudomonadota bacterium]
MNDTTIKDFKNLHDLIDELLIYIDMLKKSPDDRHITALFGTRFFSIGQLLYSYGYSELSELSTDIHGIFSKAYNSSIYISPEILQAVLSFLMLTRKALMFSDTPDFKEIADDMMLELHKSLKLLCDNNEGIEKIKLQDIEKV